MAISVFMRFHSPRDAKMLYESVRNEIGISGGATPQGRLYHIAAIVPDGMFLADMWQSQEIFKAFAVARILPPTEKRGVNSPEVEFGDVHRTLDGGISATDGIGIVARFSGNTQELLRRYDEAMATLAAEKPPQGLVFQWSLEHPEGMCIVGHWLNRFFFDLFLNGPLGYALRSAGMPEPSLEFYEIYNTIDGRRVEV